MQFRFTSSWLNPRNWFANALKGWYLRNSYLIGQKGPVWIETDKPYEIYNTVPQVRTFIDRPSRMFSNMYIRLHDKTGKDISDKDPELMRLLEKPNPLNSQNSFLFTFKRQHWVYGNQYIYKNHPSRLTRYPIALHNISPRYLNPYLSGDVWDQNTIEKIILYYEETRTKGIRKYKTTEILQTIIQDLDNPVLGVSPLEALKFPISNTVAAYKFRNVIMSNKGAIGALVNNSGDSMGGKPLTPKERKRINDEHLNKYGIEDEQMKIILSEANLDWKPFGYPTKQMMLFEEVHENFMTMCDMYGLPINLFASKNSTYENVKQSMIQAYQDTIQPEADSFMQDLTRFLKIEEYHGAGAKLCASYDHLPILKTDKAQGAQAFKNMVDALAAAVEAQMLSRAEASAIIQNEVKGYATAG